jgi:hypothetical protein
MLIREIETRRLRRGEAAVSLAKGVEHGFAYLISNCPAGFAVSAPRRVSWNHTV